MALHRPIHIISEDAPTVIMGEDINVVLCIICYE